jgi:hypothetical protein
MEIHTHLYSMIAIMCVQMNIGAGMQALRAFIGFIAMYTYSCSLIQDSMNISRQYLKL